MGIAPEGRPKARAEHSHGDQDNRAPAESRVYPMEEPWPRAKLPKHGWIVGLSGGEVKHAGSDGRRLAACGLRCTVYGVRSMACADGRGGGWRRSADYVRREGGGRRYPGGAGVVGFAPKCCRTATMRSS